MRDQRVTLCVCVCVCVRVRACVRRERERKRERAREEESYNFCSETDRLASVPEYRVLQLFVSVETRTQESIKGEHTRNNGEADF